MKKSIKLKNFKILFGVGAFCIVSCLLAEEIKVVPKEETTQAPLPVDLTGAKIKPIGAVGFEDEASSVFKQKTKSLDKISETDTEETTFVYKSRVLPEIKERKNIITTREDSLRQLGAILGNYDYSPEVTNEDIYGSSAFGDARGYLSGENIAVSVGEDKNFIRAGTASFVIAENCRRAKEKLLPLVSDKSQKFMAMLSSYDLNKLPRCSADGWNNKINTLFALCNDINSSSGKLASECQTKAVFSDCAVISGALLKPCEKYGVYFRYILGGALALSAVWFLAGSFIASGIIMSVCSVSIILSGFVAGILGGWIGIFGCFAGFFTSLVNGIKAILAFYTGS